MFELVVILLYFGISVWMIATILAVGGIVVGSVIKEWWEDDDPF